MKTHLYSLLLAGCLVSLGAGCASYHSQAKISEAAAEATALARVPGGTIKQADLEKEHGKLVWSFDITKPGTSDITEVHVDANTGEVIEVKTETAEQEAKERKKK